MKSEDDGIDWPIEYHKDTKMPSSLMARVKAAQSSSSSTPPPSSISSSSASKAPKKTSSLAAAAAAASATSDRQTYTSMNNKSTFVPSYELNPLNATASVNNVNEIVKIAVAETNAVSSSNSIALANNNNSHQDDLQNVAKSTTNPTTSSSPIIATPEKTLIEQLLQCQTKKQSSSSISSRRIQPAEYFMCSQSEALDRQTHMELSPFECYPSSLSGSPTKISTVSKKNDGGTSTEFSSPQCSTKFTTTTAANNSNSAARRIRPKYHAQHVVKKYRRSAAGGGTLNEISERNIRTLEQLAGTVEYLIEDVFVWQMPPPTSYSNTLSDGTVSTTARSGDDPNEISIWEDNDNDDQLQLGEQQPQQHTPFSLSDTVAFIDDRLRAVQKDLVTLLGNLDIGSSSSNSSSNNNISSKRLHRKQLQLKQTVRTMQSKMVRYNILTSYLLSDVPSSKYEGKFGARALRTALTCYLNLSSTLDDDYNHDSSCTTTAARQQQQLQYRKECQTKDEIMAYMALLHASAVLRSEEQALPPPSAGEVTTSLMEDSGSGWGALLSTFCKHVFVVGGGGVAVAVAAGRGGASHDNNGGGGDNNEYCQKSLVEKYPRWKWALTLACLAQEGNFQGYLKLLQKGPSLLTALSPSSSTTKLTKEEEVDNARFLLLARCCASHSLNLIRLGQLRRYNHSFGKGEKVSGKDLARLLHFDNDANDDGSSRAKLAIDFCRDAGLPIVEKEGAIELHVAMKSAPISSSKDGPIKRMCNPGRRNDYFVFGSCLEDTSRRSVDLLTNQLNECGMQQNVEDWEDCVEANDDAKGSCLPNDNLVKIEARVDEDGVAIPSIQVIQTLMG